MTFIIITIQINFFGFLISLRKQVQLFFLTNFTPNLIFMIFSFIILKIFQEQHWNYVNYYSILKYWYFKLMTIYFKILLFLTYQLVRSVLI
jgi:hypothetical protein